MSFMFTEESGNPPKKGGSPKSSAQHDEKTLTSVTSVTSVRWEGSEREDDKFPVVILPPTMAAMVEAVGRLTHTPAALSGCCALATLSAAVGKGLVIRSAEHRTTRGNIYIIAGARSGAGKSETARPFMEPFASHQRKLINSWKEETRPAATSQLAITDAQIKRLKTEAGRIVAVHDLEPIDMQLRRWMKDKEQLAALLHEPQLNCEDVTSEKLADLLARNHETMFSVSPDAGSVLSVLLGRYSRVTRTDENIYLKGYSGDPCRVDRIGRLAVSLKEPCLTVLWLIQPDKLDALFKNHSLSAGGFLPRVMPCQVDAEPTPVDRNVGGIANGLKNEWEALIHGLLECYHRYHAARSDSYVLEPTKQAIAALDAHQHRVVERRRDDLADADSYAARWNEWAWRLTVVLHAAGHGADAYTRTVGEDTANAAITLTDWFVNQQLELLSKSRASAKDEKEKAIFPLLLSMETGEENGWITARDVQRARIVSTAIEARALLSQMEADGKLVGKDQRPEAGGHTVRYFNRVSTL